MMACSIYLAVSFWMKWSAGAPASWWVWTFAIWFCVTQFIEYLCNLLQNLSERLDA